jgi:hypothetical protein
MAMQDQILNGNGYEDGDSINNDHANYFNEYDPGYGFTGVGPSIVPSIDLGY